MNENEEKAFRLCYEFYAKWRENKISWVVFADDVGKLGQDLDIEHNRLGWHLMYAVLETFNDMYQGGQVPMLSDYFGRDDLST